MRWVDCEVIDERQGGENGLDRGMAGLLDCV